MNNTLHLGDCLEIMPTIPAGSVDVVFADLPWGFSHNRWDGELDLAKLWAQYERLLAGSGVVLLVAAQPYASVIVLSNLDRFKNEWIVNKSAVTGPMNSRQRPLVQHYNVLVFSSGKHTYNPQMTIGKPYSLIRKPHVVSSYGSHQKNERETVNNGGERYPVSVLEFGPAFGLHPTQKPVTLAEYFIRTYTNPGDVVLDNCMGSGTTCVAAIRTGRQYIGIEIEQGYFEIAEQRVKDAPVPLFTD